MASPEICEIVGRFLFRVMQAMFAAGLLPSTMDGEWRSRAEGVYESRFGAAAVLITDATDMLAALPRTNATR